MIPPDLALQQGVASSRYDRSCAAALRSNAHPDEPHELATEAMAGRNVLRTRLVDPPDTPWEANALPIACTSGDGRQQDRQRVWNDGRWVRGDDEAGLVRLAGMPDDLGVAAQERPTVA